MYDISYCNIEECKNWTCEKADSCKRNLERKNIPDGVDYLTMKVFNVCKEKDYHLYIPYKTEVQEC